ncbi:MAG: transcriptional regulator GcvA [Rhodobiaceae bacterium]|nr:transcriptional regulator GcvA [Rhodobiaceae bacterium]
MSSRQLPPLSMVRAFEAAARHLSFSQAADELGVTHSAVSHQIRGLEDWLGEPLFVRAARKVHLTPAGEVLASPLTLALDTIAEAVLAVRILSVEDNGRPVLVSVEPAFAARWLVLRLDRFYAAHPDVQLHLVPTPDFVEFKDGGADIAIRYGRADWPGLVAEKLLGSASFPVVSPSLMARGKGLREPNDLAAYTLIHEDSFEDWAGWLKAAGATAVDPLKGPIFDDAHLTLEAATSGQGVALADEALAAAALEDGRLVRPFDLTLETAAAYHVVYPYDRPLRADTEAFRDWLVQEAARP